MGTKQTVPVTFRLDGKELHIRQWTFGEGEFGTALAVVFEDPGDQAKVVKGSTASLLVHGFGYLITDALWDGDTEGDPTFTKQAPEHHAVL